MTENQSSKPQLPFGARMFKAALQILALAFSLPLAVSSAVTMYKIVTIPTFKYEYRGIIDININAGIVVIVLDVICIIWIAWIERARVVDKTFVRPDKPFDWNKSV